MHGIAAGSEARRLPLSLPLNTPYEGSTRSASSSLAAPPHASAPPAADSFHRNLESFLRTHGTREESPSEGVRAWSVPPVAVWAGRGEGKGRDDERRARTLCPLRAAGEGVAFGSGRAAVALTTTTLG